MTEKDFKRMTWAFQDNRQFMRIYLLDLSRDQVREALQWCIRNDDRDSKSGHFQIGGYLISEWILAFTVRLLNPECE